MPLTRQDCPYCGGVCHLMVDFADASYAALPDRIVGLADIPVSVVCQECGHTRCGVIREMEYSWETQHIEAGVIVYD